MGETSFTYTVEGPGGARDDATVTIAVGKDTDAKAPEVDPGDGPALNDTDGTRAWNSALILFDKNDEWKRKEGAKIVAVDGQPVGIGDTADVADGKVTITDKGALNYKPYPGWQMQPLYLPSPEATAERFGSCSPRATRTTRLQGTCSGRCSA